VVATGHVRLGPTARLVAGLFGWSGERLQQYVTLRPLWDLKDRVTALAAAG